MAAQLSNLPVFFFVPSPTSPRARLPDPPWSRLYDLSHDSYWSTTVRSTIPTLALPRHHHPSPRRRKGMGRTGGASHGCCRKGVGRRTSPEEENDKRTGEVAAPSAGAQERALFWRDIAGDARAVVAGSGG